MSDTVIVPQKQQKWKETGKLILTTGDETIAVAIENLEGQGVHGIWETQQGFKGLEFCEGNEAATDNQTMPLTSLCGTHSLASKTWNSVKEMRLQQTIKQCI